MKWLIRIALLLYPRRWRSRYGRELETLVDDVPASGAILLDVVLGAMAMQLRYLPLLPVLGLFLGAAVSIALTSRTSGAYIASATVEVESEEGEPAMRQAIEEVLRRLSAAGTAPGDETSIQLVGSGENNARIRLAHSAHDEPSALAVADDLAEALAASTSAVTVVETPFVAGASYGARYGGTALAGGVIGLFAGAVVLIFLRSATRPAV